MTSQQATLLTDALLPDDVLTTAFMHEYELLKGYQLLSLRLLPYSIALSRLFDLLAGESEQRFQALVAMAKHWQAAGDFSASPSYKGTIDCQQTEHFFVVSDVMAASVLADALYREYQSELFYRQLLIAHPMLEIESLLATFVEQKRMQCRVLIESQEQVSNDGLAHVRRVA